jgi:hypothetical protein
MASRSLHVTILVLVVFSQYSAKRFLSTAAADLITINNFGFEDPVLADGLTSGTSTPGWSRIGASTILNPSNSHFAGGTAPQDQNVATLNAGGSGSTLFQNLPATTLQYGTYTFEFEIGDRLDQAFHNVSFNFLINASTIVPVTSSSKPSVSDGSFATWTFTYEVLDPNVFNSFIGDPTRIRFLAFGSSGFSTIDNVRGTFVSAVPEPSSLWLVMGLVTMAIFQRYARKPKSHLKKSFGSHLGSDPVSHLGSDPAC